MDENKGYTRKNLNFDLNNDKDQEVVYKFLEKIRYYQTKFITKLVMEFLRKYNITEKTNYKDIKSIIQLYLNDNIQPQMREPEYQHVNLQRDYEKSTDPINTKATAEIITQVLQSLLLNNSNNLVNTKGQAESVPLPAEREHTVENNSSKEEKTLNTPKIIESIGGNIQNDNFSNDIITEKHEIITDDTGDEDDDEDDIISNMLSGFQSMKQ